MVYKSLLSAKFMTFSVVLFCELSMYKIKNNGPKTEPCGTPALTLSQVDV